ncbi:hypothetical protein [Allorhodopirellula solitaria]|nr:hypothetical protein [Allorhodopirellula solitaria]
MKLIVKPTEIVLVLSEAVLVIELSMVLHTRICDTIEFHRYWSHRFE